MKEKDINFFLVVTMLQNLKCHKYLEILEGVQTYGGDGLVFKITMMERNHHFGKIFFSKRNCNCMNYGQDRY